MHSNHLINYSKLRFYRTKNADVANAERHKWTLYISTNDDYEWFLHANNNLQQQFQLVHYFDFYRHAVVKRKNTAYPLCVDCNFESIKSNMSFDNEKLYGMGFTHFVYISTIFVGYIFSYSLPFNSIKEKWLSSSFRFYAKWKWKLKKRTIAERRSILRTFENVELSTQMDERWNCVLILLYNKS